MFKDVDSIEPGDDFVAEIAAAVGSCRVLLAVIGARWLGVTNMDGRRRLDDPEDFVRLEIEATLERGIRVIPVLVDETRMPQVTQLPASLASLARRHALELRSDRFGSDVGRLVSLLDKSLTDAADSPAARTSANASHVEPSSAARDRPDKRQTAPGPAARNQEGAKEPLVVPAGQGLPSEDVPYITPLVQKLADERGLDLATVPGTGVGGRIRKQDVLDAARARQG